MNLQPLKTASVTTLYAALNNTAQTLRSSRMRRYRQLGAALLVATLAGCANQPSCATHVEAFRGTLLMQPGWTGHCLGPPCTVKFVMPAGQGSYEVLADGVSLGSFAAGETVTLGEFSRGHIFEVKDTGLRTAQLFVQ